MTALYLTHRARWAQVFEDTLMSDVPADLTGLDYREQLARIDRALAETQKFLAETQKIKFDFWLSPLLAVGACIAGFGGLVVGVAALLKTML